VTPSLKIRRSDAYGTTAAVVLLPTMFLASSTPDWYLTLTWVLAAGLAGAALFFSEREWRAGQTGMSLGLALVALIAIWAIFILFNIVSAQ
jgi:hypothetical protein